MDQEDMDMDMKKKEGRKKEKQNHIVCIGAVFIDTILK